MKFNRNHLVSNTSSNHGSSKDGIMHNIVNNTFSENTAQYGGAVASELTEQDFLCFNNIFYNDMATFGEEIYLSAIPVHLYNNNIDLSKIEGGIWLGENNINVDPQFDTDGYHLLPESECIEGGLNFLDVYGVTYCCPQNDIDGEPRPQNTFADIGVDECLITGTVAPNNIEIENNRMLITPNPVKEEAKINFHINEKGFTNLCLYNLKGKKLQSFVNEILPSGNFEVKLDLTGLVNGTYLFVLKSNDGIQTKKIIKLK
jgi:hypothetical protein